MPKVKKRNGILPKSAQTHQQKQQPQQAPRPKQASSTNTGTKRPAGAAGTSPAPKRQRHDPTQPRQQQQAQQQQQQQQQWYCRSVIDRQAADAVSKLLRAAQTQQSGATIKSLTLAPHIAHKKATFAVTCETLKFLPLLKQLLAHAGVLEQHAQLPEACAYVVAYELLFGQGVREFGPVEAALSKAQAAMRSHLAELMEIAGAETPEALLSSEDSNQPPPTPHPRTARVNTLKTTVAAALQQLQQEGFKGVHVDELLPDVLVLVHGTDLHDHGLVKEGALILQSKASCMPAHALNPNPGWTIVDCCAAPGNKTTHVAALVGAAGKVLAFDKDPKRLKRLQGTAKMAGAVNVQAQCADFLSLDTSEPRFAEVRGVILDPSCSGSGTVVSRMDHLLPRSSSVGGEGATGDDGGSQRVEQLARFQEAALRHALTFPALERLAYSTCSVHQRENEAVVAAVLPYAQELGFKLVPALPAWHRRGLPGVQGSEMLLRTDAYEDGTDGFFVAVFERARGHMQQIKQEQQDEQQNAELEGGHELQQQQHADAGSISPAAGGHTGKQKKRRTGQPGGVHRKQ